MAAVVLDAILTLVVVGAGVAWALTGRDSDTSQGGLADAGGGRRIAGHERG